MIRRTTLVILVIFAALVAGTIFWQRSQDQIAEQATPTVSESSVLFEPESEIVEMRLEEVGGRVVELARDEEGNWQLTWPEAIEADNEAVEESLSQLTDLQVMTTLEQPLDLAIVGLDTPSYRMLIVLDNGEQFVMNVGKETPTESGYYVISSDRKMYIVNKYGLDSFLEILESPPIKPVAIPTLEPLEPSMEEPFFPLQPYPYPYPNP